MPPRTRKPADPPAEDVTADAVPPLTLDPTPDLLALPPRLVPTDYAGEGEVALPAPFPGTVRLMSTAEYQARLAHLVAPFPADRLERLPKALRNGDQDKGRCDGDRSYSADGYACGGWHARSIHLTYVGHAGITERLLEVDPLYSLEPVEVGERGVPIVRPDGSWFRLTILGMTRLAFGDAGGKSGPNAVKEVIGDALRNGAMRFGVATYLWSKSEGAQVLAAGGDLDDAPRPPVPQPAPATPRTQRRAAAQADAHPDPDRIERSGPPSDHPAPPAPAATAIAFQRQVVDTVNDMLPGEQRDGFLRTIRDRAREANALDVQVPVPAQWQADGRDDTTARLLDLILAARTLTIRTTPPVDDPWQTPQEPTP